MSDNSPTRPALRYHGGKWLLAPWIISHFPPHKIYIEPYCGAASVLMRKVRSYDEVINDLEDDVVNLFRVLRVPATRAQLCDALQFTPFSRVEFTEAYEPTEDLIERARRLVVRSFQGFGSGSFNRNYCTGFRAASKQMGRPHSKDWANVPDGLWAVGERLKGVTIESRDALHVIRQQDHPEALFYVDPPYLHSTRPNSNRKQYQFEMTVDDHRALATMLRAVKSKVIVSGYPSELYEQLYAGWKRAECTAQASGQHGRIQRTEVLWMNF